MHAPSWVATGKHCISSYFEQCSFFLSVIGLATVSVLLPSIIQLVVGLQVSSSNGRINEWRWGRQTLSGSDWTGACYLLDMSARPSWPSHLLYFFCYIVIGIYIHGSAIYYCCRPHLLFCAIFLCKAKNPGGKNKKLYAACELCHPIFLGMLGLGSHWTIKHLD